MANLYHHRFTFKEQKPMAKKCTTLTNNVAGVLYEAVRKTSARNVRFKAAFIATLPKVNNYGKTVRALLHYHQQHGELKCVCCGNDNVYFKFHKDKGRVTFKAMVSTGKGEMMMTVDHNVLKTLGGSDSISNYNPMCYKCNQVRGSRFAEYKEFKEWYDSQEVIDTIAGMPDANFCFIDYKLNRNGNHFFNNIIGAKTLPPQLVNAMKKTMRSPKPDVFKHISMKEFISLDREYANKLLNELVYERSFNTLNCKDVPMGDYDFFINSGSCDHRKIKMWIENRIAKQLSKRLEIQRELTQNKVQPIVEATPATVNASFTLKGMWTKFVSIFA